MPDDLEYLSLQIDTLFSHDAARRLRYLNEPGEREAPRFFLGRTRAGNLYRFRRDLPEAIIGKLEALALSETTGKLRADPSHAAAYQEVLGEQHAVRRVGAWPAYTFPVSEMSPAGAVQITEANKELLVGEFAWLKAILADKEPCAAVVVEHRAVAVCHSARTSVRAAEAGLETLSAFRGRGYAAVAARGWAALVRQQGRIPLYSTSWSNVASQGVARKLGLIQYATDFHLT